MLKLFNILELLAINFIFFYNLTRQHNVPPTTPCLAAVTCNHIGIAICGTEKDQENNRMFLDECDMFEYNCGNHKLYFKTDLEQCTDNATAKTKIRATQGIQNQTTVVNNIITMGTNITTLNPNITHISESATSKLNTTKATLSNSTFKSCTCTVPSNVTITESDKILTFNSTTIKENVTKPLTIVTEKYITSNTEVNNNTIPSDNQLQSGNISCNIYPKHCKRPHTWETTVKGETRDFFQILRARYGNRVKVLEDTTHWPAQRRLHINDDNSFQFGRHYENDRFV